MVLKRVFPTVSIAALLLLGGCVRQARAQFIGFTSPQTDQELALNAATGPTTFNVHNLGQNVHFLSYTIVGTATQFDLRLEGSNDGTTFFPISDDAVDGFTAAGTIYAIGYYPVIRVNLVAFNGTSITANYSGTSGTAGPLLGQYGPGIVARKVVLSNQSMGSSASATIEVPFGSTLGYLVFTVTAGSFPVGSTIQVNQILANNAGFGVSQALPTGGGNQILVPANLPATAVQVVYTSGGASANRFSLFYLFVNPAVPTGLSSSQAQPPTSINAEVTATAAVASKGVAPILGARVSLFSLSARCSAGTAQLTVTDGSTQIWSSGSTEVGTTTFRFQWNPGLASSIGNGMTVSLSSCGVGNTGTLDVEASQF